MLISHIDHQIEQFYVHNLLQNDTMIEYVYTNSFYTLLENLYPLREETTICSYIQKFPFTVILFSTSCYNHKVSLSKISQISLVSLLQKLIH